MMVNKYHKYDALQDTIQPLVVATESVYRNKEMANKYWKITDQMPMNFNIDYCLHFFVAARDVIVGRK